MKRYNWKQNEVAYCNDCLPEKNKIRRAWHNFFGHSINTHWHKSDTPDLFKEKSDKPFVFFQHVHKHEKDHRFYREIHRNIRYRIPKQKIIKRYYWNFIDWGYYKGYFHFITPDGIKSRIRDFRLGREKIVKIPFKGMKSISSSKKGTQIIYNDGTTEFEKKKAPIVSMKRSK